MSETVEQLAGKLLELADFWEPNDIAASTLIRQAVAALNNRQSPTDDMVERVSKAIQNADDEIGYSCKLVRLVDGVSTYTLDYDNGEPVLEFDSYSDAMDHVQRRRNLSRARAAITALQGDSQ